MAERQGRNRNSASMAWSIIPGQAAGEGAHTNLCVVHAGFFWYLAQDAS
jgi:hypothetical protein